MATRQSLNNQHLAFLRQQGTSALVQHLRPLLQAQEALLAVQTLERQRLQQLSQALAASQRR